MSDYDPLRTEIVESEKARTDLLKYKLIAIAAIGTIGLGFGEAKGEPLIDRRYVLCIIPIACIFVDLLCWHNTLRIRAIARFLRSKSDAYEAFLKNMPQAGNMHAPEYYFAMEDWGILGSTIIPSFILVLWGVADFLWALDLAQFPGNGCEWFQLVLWLKHLRSLNLELLLRGFIFFFIGVGSIVSWFYYWGEYKKRSDELCGPLPQAQPQPPQPETARQFIVYTETTSPQTTQPSQATPQPPPAIR